MERGFATAPKAPAKGWARRRALTPACPAKTFGQAEGSFYDFAMLSLLYNMRIFDILLMN
jgi:hypothetical protein